MLSPTTPRYVATTGIAPSPLRYSPTGFQLLLVNRSNDDISPPEVWTCDLDGRNRTKLFDNAFWADFK